MWFEMRFWKQFDKGKWIKVDTDLLLTQEIYTQTVNVEGLQTLLKFEWATISSEVSEWNSQSNTED